MELQDLKKKTRVGLLTDVVGLGIANCFIIKSYVILSERDRNSSMMFCY